MAKRLVVVGVDCSPASDTTLDWALESAARRGSRIDVVHAWTWGPLASEFMVPEAPAQLAEAASEAVTGQVERAMARRPADAPPVEVRACALEGDPAAVLVRASASADALVLGRHGQSALTTRLVGPVLGSVAAFCLDRLGRAGGRRAGPDAGRPRRHGSSSASTARPAAPGRCAGPSPHADALGVPVVAVLAWQLTTLPAPSSATGGVAPLPDWEASAARLLESSLEEALPAGRAADVQPVVLHEPAARGLLGVGHPRRPARAGRPRAGRLRAAAAGVDEPAVRRARTLPGGRRPPRHRLDDDD